MYSAGAHYRRAYACNGRVPCGRRRYFLRVHGRCVELVAGTVGEKLFLDGPFWLAVDDLRQARAYVGMICSSLASVEAFLDFCRVEPAALLTSSAHIVYALAAELAQRRTMNGAEVDEVIERVVAEKALAKELARRADWVRTARTRHRLSRTVMRPYWSAQCEPK